MEKTNYTKIFGEERGRELAELDARTRKGQADLQKVIDDAESLRTRIHEKGIPVKTEEMSSEEYSSQITAYLVSQIQQAKTAITHLSDTKGKLEEKKSTIATSLTRLDELITESNPNNKKEQEVLRNLKKASLLTRTIVNNVYLDVASLLKTQNH